MHETLGSGEKRRRRRSYATKSSEEGLVGDQTWRMGSEEHQCCGPRAQARVQSWEDGWKREVGVGRLGRDALSQRQRQREHARPEAHATSRQQPLRGTCAVRRAPLPLRGALLAPCRLPPPAPCPASGHRPRLSHLSVRCCVPLNRQSAANEPTSPFPVQRIRPPSSNKQLQPRVAIPSS